MEAMFKPPEPLALDGNIAENWRRFSQKFDVFLQATDLSNKSEEEKKAVFLNLIGDEGLELYNSFTFLGDENKTVEGIKQKFEEYCAPQKNVIFERYKFNSLVQKEGQNFDNFVTELRKAVKTTEYKESDDMIRDRVVMGIFDKSTQERLLREPKLTLDKAVNFCRATESSKSQSKALQNENQVNAMRTGRGRNVSSRSLCKYCGYKHDKGRKCPAYGKTCIKCQGRNHFASVCTSSDIKPTEKDSEKKSKKRAVHEVEMRERDSSEENGSSEEFYVDSLKSIGSLDIRDNNTRTERLWKQKLEIEGQQVEFKLDTGAEVSVLPLEILKKLKLDCDIRHTEVLLLSYGSPKFRIKPRGEICLTCKVNGNVSRVVMPV